MWKRKLFRKNDSWRNYWIKAIRSFQVNKTVWWKWGNHTCTTTTKILVKRPAGSEGTTEGSAYAPPSATCKGHNILDKITNDQIQLIVNTPRGKKGTTDDSYIRKAAIKNRIPYITTMAAAKATVEGIRSAKRDGKLPVQSLQEFHASIIDK